MEYEEGGADLRQSVSRITTLEQIRMRPVIACMVAWAVYSLAFLLPTAKFFGLTFSVDDVPIVGTIMHGGGVERSLTATCYILTAVYSFAGFLKLKASLGVRQKEKAAFTYLAIAALLAALPSILGTGYSGCCFGCSAYPSDDADIFKNLLEARQHGFVANAATLVEYASLAFGVLASLWLFFLYRKGWKKGQGVFFAVSALFLVVCPVLAAAPAVRQSVVDLEVPVHVWQDFNYDSIWAESATPEEIRRRVESLSVAKIPGSVVGLPTGTSQGTIKATGATFKYLRLENGEVVFTRPKIDTFEAPVEMIATIGGKDYRWRVLLVH